MARVGDLAPVLPTLLGKIEFEMGEEGRERAVLDHLLRLAVAATFRERLSGVDLSGFTAVFAEGAVVETGDLVPAATCSTSSAAFRACPRCSTGWATTTPPAGARPPQRRSSPWRACT